MAALPSERDQNFLISVEGGGRLVLKIANLHDAPELLDFQNLAMRHVALAAPECRVQRVLRSLDGTDIARARNVRTAPSTACGC